jgi:hypothetical protein
MELIALFVVSFLIILIVARAYTFAADRQKNSIKSTSYRFRPAAEVSEDMKNRLYDDAFFGARVKNDWPSYDEGKNLEEHQAALPTIITILQEQENKEIESDQSVETLLREYKTGKTENSHG